MPMTREALVEAMAKFIDEFLDRHDWFSPKELAESYRSVDLDDDDAFNDAMRSLSVGLSRVMPDDGADGVRVIFAHGGENTEDSQEVVAGVKQTMDAVRQAFAADLAGRPLDAWID